MFNAIPIKIPMTIITEIANINFISLLKRELIYGHEYIKGSFSLLRQKTQHQFHGGKGKQAY
jgi:hypothetical protein